MMKEISAGNQRLDFKDDELSDITELMEERLNNQLLVSPVLLWERWWARRLSEFETQNVAHRAYGLHNLAFLTTIDEEGCLDYMLYGFYSLLSPPFIY